MNRDVCEHFNPVDLPCAKCEEKRKSEALFLADELEIPLGTVIQSEVNRRAAAELRRLHAKNEALRKTLAASCDEERQQLWEAGPGGGCSRALSAEFQRDALLEALKLSRAQWIHSVNSDHCLAAIKAAEGENT